MALSSAILRVRQESGNPGASDISDTQIGNFLDDAENYVETYTGKEFSVTEVTELYDGNGKDTLILNYDPVIALSSLKIDGIEQNSSQYFLYKDVGKIVLNNAAITDSGITNVFPVDRQNVSVSYTYGDSKALLTNDVIILIAVKRALLALSNLKSEGADSEKFGGYSVSFHRYQYGGIIEELNKDIESKLKVLGKRIDAIVV